MLSIKQVIFKTMYSVIFLMLKFPMQLYLYSSKYDHKHLYNITISIIAYSVGKVLYNKKSVEKKSLFFNKHYLLSLKVNRNSNIV